MRAGNIADGEFQVKDADRFPLENLDKVGIKKSQPGDVVLTTKGTVGRFAFMRNDDEAFVYSPQLSFWRVLDRTIIEPRFLYYWIRGKEFAIQCDSVKGQTDMADYVSLADQRRMRITLPPLPTQRRIAEILGRLDDKIALNRRLNRVLEEMAQALYKHHFVDFGPYQEGAFVGSELGSIPRGWEVDRLGDHVKAIKGLSYKGKWLADEGMPLHNLNSIYEGGGYKYEGIKYYTGEYKEKHLIKPGDLIVANTEQGFDYLLIGCPAIVPKRYGADGLFTHHIYKVEFKKGSPLTSSFLYFWLKNPALRQSVTAFTNGTTVNMLSRDGLQHPRIIVPTPEAIQKFENLAQTVLDKIEQHAEENRKLAEIRDYLLPRLLSGEILV